MKRRDAVKVNHLTSQTLPNHKSLQLTNVNYDAILRVIRKNFLKISLSIKFYFIIPFLKIYNIYLQRRSDAFKGF